MLNEKRGTHEHGEFRKSSLAGPISGLMSYDGRVLRLAYEVGKTDGNYRKRGWGAMPDMTAGERVVIFEICNFSVPVA